jgi:hypothetical protein
MPWIETHEQPSNQAWQPTQAINPLSGAVEPAVRCRACGWITLRRWLPTGHECLGRARDWSCEPRALVEVHVESAARVALEPVRAGESLEGQLARVRRVA